MHTKAFSGRVWSRVIEVHKRCDNTFNFKWELCLNCCQVPQRLISQICRHDGSVSKQANTVLLQTSSRLRAFVPKECQIDIRQQWWLFNGVFTTVILQIHFTNLTNSDWTDSSSNQLSFLVAPFPDGCDWQTIRHVRSSDLFFPTQSWCHLLRLSKQIAGQVISTRNGGKVLVLFCVWDDYVQT